MFKYHGPLPFDVVGVMNCGMPGEQLAEKPLAVCQLHPSQIVPVQVQEVEDVVVELVILGAANRILQSLKICPSIRRQGHDFAIKDGGSDVDSSDLLCQVR